MPLSEYPGGGVNCINQKLNTMKKLLLTFIIILISGITFAQDRDSVKYKSYDIEKAVSIIKSSPYAPGLITTYKGRRVYFDYKSDQYILEEHFARRYGPGMVKAMDELYIKQREEYQRKIEMQKTLECQRPTFKPDQGIDDEGKKYKLKLKPRNLVIGTSVIGASAAVYMLTSSAVSTRSKGLAEELANHDIDSDEYAKEIESLDKTKRTVGFICAGTSLAGVIVVLTGIYRDYDNGINLGHNFTVSDYGAGISLTKRF